MSPTTKPTLKCSGSWRPRCRTVCFAFVLPVLCLVGLRCTSNIHETSSKRKSTLESKDDGTAETPLPEQSWVDFESPDHDFHVLMPVPPERSLDSVSTPIGMQPVTRFKAHADGIEFDAGYLQRSANVLTRLVGQQSILESACEGTAKHMGGKVLTSKAITLNDHPARDISIGFAVGERESGVARLVITDERIYHAIVRMPANPSAVQSNEARWFLSSMRVQDTTAAVKQ